MGYSDGKVSEPTRMEDDENTSIAIEEPTPEKISQRVKEILLAQPLNELTKVEFSLLPIRPTEP